MDLFHLAKHPVVFVLTLSATVFFRSELCDAKLSREELSRRFAESIERTKNYKVTLDDVLGEGTGAWDSDPRYPTDTVNCLIWLQLILAEVYGKGLADKTPVLDQIRYFGGHVGFSTRKHYVDQWINLEPGPLWRVNTAACAFPYYQHFKLDTRPFLEHQNFTCGLYGSQQLEFDLQYVKADGLLKCGGKLPDGYYILFGVPSEEYAKAHLQNTGPMGLVHSMIVKIERGNQAMIYHASTSAKAVLTEKLDAFLARMKNLYEGYVVFEPNPDWAPKPLQLKDPETRRLLECEAKLPRR